ncbi:hypothetical protein YC2023_026365 [Brassica napus]
MARGKLNFLSKLMMLVVTFGRSFNQWPYTDSKQYDVLAVIYGYYVGHFSRMVKAMQHGNPLSITHVSTKLELKEAINLLLSNPEILEANQGASKEAYESLSSCIVSSIWNLLSC